MGAGEDVFFFDGWESLGRLLIVGVVAYAALVAFLRISGKRTLAKLNAFDLVVTVALGSTLATVILSRDVPLADGVLALALLIALQYVVAWLNLHSRWFTRLVKNEPSVLVRDGVFDRERMAAERVAPEEIEAAVRAAGLEQIGDSTVVLETDGTISVVS